MNHDQVTELLKNYRSYRYAAKNCGEPEGRLPVLYSERRRNLNGWDQDRYHRIVNMITGAVEDVLSDDQRTVISRKYLDRNTLTLSEIADILHKDRTTVSRWHTEAIRRLTIALQPLSADEREINNVDHMFDPTWKHVETA
ncbi:sigma factor-like helix-turn-helix DNA-binding protein [Paenibacillus spongiae]|uniref:RNA polymerase sigma-70 region 4 domain-containing protein n=1 Tax=Paenibacillus spongiae TaxID=2909671 RepID=A0ABY5SEV3_9BACL|nr:sigma factor-like helix-turn-helix DNA-binding protein [Paenibacillus spongiae]UVI31203.1 hypothetical protein L1F29_04995 [Paenibacillus spongiae]